MTSTSRALWPLVAVSLAFGACVESTEASPPLADGGALDVGTSDGGGDATAPEADAATTDATLSDAGMDAAAEDAGDASLDAGAVDAAVDAADAADAALFSIDAGPTCVPTGDQTSLSAAAAGLPSTGLALWLRADRGIYAISGDGGALTVCAWLDLSGHSIVLANTSAALPTWLPTAVGGQPALQFNGGAENLATSGVLGIGATSGRTFVAVEMLVAGKGRFEPIVQGQGASSGTYVAIDANTFSTAGNREGVITPNNAYDTATTTSTIAPRVHVYTITTMAAGTDVLSAIDYRVNGTTQTLTRKGGAGNTKMEDFSGANFTAVGAAFPSTTGVAGNAMVAEVLVYDRALSGTEAAAVETALKGRYGIP